MESYPQHWQRAEQDWHEALYESHRGKELVVPHAIRERYDRIPDNPRFHLELMFKLAGDVRGKRVLVFGCGDDTSPALLAFKGAEVWAFDLSENAIRLQRGMARANGVCDRLRAVVCAAEEFPFADNSFDLIIGAAILHHVPDHLAELPAKLARALKANGKALFAEPVLLSATLGRFLQWLPGHQEISPGERQLTRDDLSHFAEQFEMKLHPFCFLARLDRFLLKGPLETAPSWRRLLVQAIHRVDQAILSIPYLNRLAGVAVLELSRIVPPDSRRRPVSS